MSTLLDPSRVVTFADGWANVRCPCGATDVYAGETLSSATACASCGRRFATFQAVVVEEAIGRCPGCGEWVYGTQRQKKRFCSERCAVRVRREAQEHKEQP